MKVITPGKRDPYKCRRPSSNISVKKDFSTLFFLTNDFQVLSVMFIEYRQNVNKHDISGPILHLLLNERSSSAKCDSEKHFFLSQEA